MMVTSDPLHPDDAKRAMAQMIPGFNKYLEKGQILILPYSEWYVIGGEFDTDRVLAGWQEKLVEARKKGFAGLRLSGNTFWLEKNHWAAFTDYEEKVNETIGNHNMIALCTYSIDRCDANEILDVVKNHQFALTKRTGQWNLIENTEHRALEDRLRGSEEKFTKLVSSMTEGVAIHSLVFDEKGTAIDYRITDVNPAFEQILGIARDKAVGSAGTALYGTDKAPFLDVYVKVAITGVPASFDVFFRPMKKHFSISVFSFAPGTFTTVFQDITKRKTSEELLIKANQDLHRRTLELNAANKEIESFSYSVSHDLRAPLRSLTGFSDILIEDYAKTLDKEGLDFLKRLHDSAQKMDDLVQAILRLSRQTRKELQIETLDLSKIANTIVMRLKKEYPGRNVTVTISNNLTAEGDADLVTNALDNLLQNAWKYTKKKKHAIIEVGLLRLNNEPVFYVKDNGAGFDMKYADKLFVPFQRLHNEQDFPGIGIGLSTVQRIVQKHGGRIWAESAPEKGATFYFTLADQVKLSNN